MTPSCSRTTGNMPDLLCERVSANSESRTMHHAPKELIDAGEPARCALTTCYRRMGQNNHNDCNADSRSSV